MVVKRPTMDEFFRIAEAYNLNPSPADVESYLKQNSSFSNRNVPRPPDAVAPAAAGH